MSGMWLLIPSHKSIFPIKHSHSDSTNADKLTIQGCDTDLPNLSFLTNVYWFGYSLHITVPYTSNVVCIDLQANTKLLGFVNTKGSGFQQV